MRPIIPAPAADPWMVFHRGCYYFCESRNQLTLHVRKSKNILEIGADPGVCVWRPPATGPASQNLWAPELHHIDGRWYIYYAADDGKNENHRMWVLRSEDDNPQGKYHCCGKLETGGWAIDGTVIESAKGLYFVWSGWPGNKDGQQNLYIAPMASPTSITALRQLLTTPDQEWERRGMPICEGPQALRRGKQIFIIYSSSASWTADYCLGMLAGSEDTVADPRAWKKVGPVFQKNEHVWGVGHCSFVKSPCQTEDWILYHAKSDRRDGWIDRHVHAQPFTWHESGIPNFATPQPVPRPTQVQLAAV